MLKKNIEVIVAFMLGATIFGGLGVYAITLLASEIPYTNNNQQNVQGTIDDLYNKTKYLGKIKVGDYVSMTPTLTSYEILGEDTGCVNGVTCGDITDGSPQEINPSELNVWRIISINSDGTADAVSEYVSSTNIHFRGKTGYQNYVGTLNKIAGSYTNPSYVIKTRHMGYSGQTNYISDTSKIDETIPPWTANTSISTSIASEQQGGGDIGYETDYNLVKNVVETTVANKVGTPTGTEYWLASRYYGYSSSTSWDFNVWYIDADNAYRSVLYSHGNSGFSLGTRNKAVRPIITLKSGLTTNGGDGKSETTAWTFE